MDEKHHRKEECVGGSVLILVLGAYAVTVGVLFLDQCQVERKIPIYLITIGATLALLAIFSILESWCCNDLGALKIVTWILLIILGITLFGMLIYGIVLVFQTYDTVTYEDAQKATHCREFAYRSFFWITVIPIAVVVLVASVIGSCLCVCMLCLGKGISEITEKIGYNKASSDDNEEGGGGGGGGDDGNKDWN